MWWLKARLLAPLWFGRSNGFLARKIKYPGFGSGQPEVKPYQELAALWHGFSGARRPNYTPFLAGLAARRNLRIHSVLDLACGSGTVTQCLAAAFPQVVGLDSSPAMIEQARVRCQHLPNVRFVEASFHDFHLGQQFEAVVCAADSLNYVADGVELAQVFHCVAEHLKPGGLFTFDALTDRRMALLSGWYHHSEVEGKRLVVGFNYDAAKRQETSTVYFADGIEIHRRIPLAAKDVRAAAAGTGLVLEDYFSFASIPGRWFTGARCFYVMSKSVS